MAIVKSQAKVTYGSVLIQVAEAEGDMSLAEFRAMADASYLVVEIAVDYYLPLSVQLANTTILEFPADSMIKVERVSYGSPWEFVFSVDWPSIVGVGALTGAGGVVLLLNKIIAGFIANFSAWQDALDKRQRRLDSKAEAQKWNFGPKSKGGGGSMVSKDGFEERDQVPELARMLALSVSTETDVSQDKLYRSIMKAIDKSSSSKSIEALPRMQARELRR